MDNERSRRGAPSYVIAAGTQVVLQTLKVCEAGDEKNFKKSGAVGLVLRCPDRADGMYSVEFSDGSVVQASFDELTLRRQEIDIQLAESSDDFLAYVIYRAQVGSKAFGLANEESDDDIRGIFVPPAECHWSLFEVPEQIEFLDGGRDEVFWEIEKFLRLALKANPSVLEVLWTPIVLESSEIAERLRTIRRSFLSKHVYKTHSGYVLSQFRRMKSSYEKTGKFKVKHAMHLVRLLYCGIGAMETGEIPIDVGHHRDELLSIRRGEWSFESIRQHALLLGQKFQAAFEVTRLPEQPDFATVNQFLIDIRRGQACHDRRETPSSE